MACCVPCGTEAAAEGGGEVREGGMVCENQGLGVTEGDSRWGCVQWALGTPRAPCPLLSHYVLLHPGGPSTTTGQPSHSRAHRHRAQALMYPELMFNECSIFRRVHAKPENGFIVFLLRRRLVHLYFAEASVCMCVCVCVCVRPVFTRVCGVPDKCIY